MKPISIENLTKRGVLEKAAFFIALIIMLYLLIALYFTNHFFFNTTINGVDLSLKGYKDADTIIEDYLKNYKLLLIERNGITEILDGNYMDLKYNKRNGIYKIYHKQNAFFWIFSILGEQQYSVIDMFNYNRDRLNDMINELHCLEEKGIIKPHNVNFKYYNGSYNVIKEIYGNQVIKSKLSEAIYISVLYGKRKLDLNAAHCYVNPKYTLSSDKTMRTRNVLNKYVSSKVIYLFGKKKEILDGTVINNWLGVDENLDVVINKKEVLRYVYGLSKKYNTVGISRNFQTSIGKIIEIKGGLYGWKINREAEANTLINNIKQGEKIEKEPIYIQKALTRDENEIGNTYVEVNITRQYVWFYKEGVLIAQGPVVTGNPNRGNATVLGVYMLNYKQKDVTLTGPGYEAGVTYWMPFYGNIGLHDAKWRYAFGGEIYKRNGTHGCVNMPYILAKTIYENIKEGIPIICYEE